MEISVWRLLLIVSMLTGYFPALRFRNHSYFYYFAFSSIIEPLYIFFRITKLIGDIYYIPFFLAAALAILPGQFRIVRLLLGIAVFILSLHFLNNLDVLIIIKKIFITVILVFLINENLESVKKESKIMVFLLLLAMNMLLLNGSIILYYENIGLYTKCYSIFLILNILSYALIALAGPNKYIKVRYKQNLESVPKALKNAKVVEINSSANINSVSNDLFDDKFSNKELEVFIHLSEGLQLKLIFFILKIRWD
ncbi:MAG: hypothetical protein FD188_3583 [Ignavibacteria bacterium]|nr:MAG: hypothetical protein FD188_3583 [Ignavibacteria bacterium]